MLDVQMTGEEIEILCSITERYLHALLFEIANTDSRELRAHLRHREEVLHGLIERMKTLRDEAAAREAAAPVTG